MKNKYCDYCNKLTEYVDSEVIYGKSYGMIYLCRPCDAYVGVHKGTNNPLGRLANKELRAAKKDAHKYFDNLWQRKMERGYKKGHARAKAYIWLSKELGIPPKLTHIGMFDVADCKRVVEICRSFYKE